MALKDIDTIVVAILENRSFDHMLGYLSLPGANGPPGLEGLQGDQKWVAAVANPREGHAAYAPSLISSPEPVVDDPPHDRESIAMQISAAAAARPSMGGFVESYLRFSKEPPADPGSVMAYHDQRSVPTFDAFAHAYCTCDHWFASLPLGTQANRLMAMSGDSRTVFLRTSGAPPTAVRPAPLGRRA